MQVILRSFCTISMIILANIAHAENRVSVASVNGETIWLDQVMQAAEGLPPEYRNKPMQDYFGDIVADIIDTKLAAKAGEAAKLADDPLVQDAMKLASERILAEAWLAVTVREKMTDEALQQAYDTFVADEASREQITASHILVAAEDEAVAIIKDLNDGADFAEIAKEKSTGPSGPNGGELGTFGRGQMVPAFETAAFALPAGSFSAKPVQTQFGWHVIKVSEKAVKPAPSFDDMRDQLVNSLSRQHLGRVIEGLRADQKIELRSFEDVRTEVQAKAQ
ncbi:MAG: peptidylprolyl isomerase [Candidatus Puniceispirillum sp.]|jgi:peptidyl-prolyl cis-trans isomerase C|uniref:peptidylprolyl isomerase n=1 Tax=Candidatus Puniceispirillum sp. TaxID=2026719 RepID=UPI001EB88E63|nr:peptidylprolyl isomerase [Candidatus Puniceispirillum sp.]MBT6416802.1 peptidylprolyl isomerase [Candidatus Puniceispirillum sp.]MBT6565744.1 peptidylprolyl isomerase [Candidatus Puniceispirillum sp.]